MRVRSRAGVVDLARANRRRCERPRCFNSLPRGKAPTNESE